MATSLSADLLGSAGPTVLFVVEVFVIVAFDNVLGAFTAVFAAVAVEPAELAFAAACGTCSSLKLGPPR